MSTSAEKGHGTVSAGRGTLVVISAPSGAGKTTLVKGLLQRNPVLRFSISFTTRPPRPGEVPGRDYFFVDEDRFRHMLEHREFLEHAKVFGHSYGTSRAQVDTLLAAGHNVLLEIDWQGAKQIRDNAPACRSIFVMPPSVAELERRLRGRATDSEDVIRRRLAGALAEMAHWAEFDFVVINEQLPDSLAAVEAIIQGQGEDWSTRSEAWRARVTALAAN